MNTNKKVCLVLGGGGAKSFSYLGIMEVLKENGITVDRIVTSSMGSLIGILLAHEIPLDKIKEAFYKRCKRSYWIRPHISKNSLLSQSPVKKLLKNLLPSEDLQETKIPISIVATNINTLEETIIEKGNAIDAVCASCAHPLLNKPIEINGSYYSDGGITNNVPADIFRKKFDENAFIITATCSSPFDKTTKILSRADIVLRAIYHSLEKQRVKITTDFSDVVIAPFQDQTLDFRNWIKICRFYDYKKLNEYYELGKKAAKEKIPDIPM